MDEELARALLLLALVGLCAAVFFAPLVLSLRRRRLRAAGRPERVYPDAIVVINTAIGIYLLWSLWWVYVEA